MKPSAIFVVGVLALGAVAVMVWIRNTAAARASLNTAQAPRLPGLPGVPGVPGEGTSSGAAPNAATVPGFPVAPSGLFSGIWQ